jgi:hypothetical protein
MKILLQQGFSRLNYLQRSFLSALAGLLAYGIWGYLVNSPHGAAAAYKAACVQGSYSFMLTFVMTLLIEALYRLFARLSGSVRLIRFASIVSVCSIIYTTSWWVNVFAGTPEIFNTVILGYVVGGIYTVGYVQSLAQHDSQNNLPTIN